MNRTAGTMTALAATSSLAIAAWAAPRKPAPRKPVAAPNGAKVPTRAMSEAEARRAVAMLNDAYQIVLEETHTVYHTKPSAPVAATVVRKLQARMSDLGWPRSRFLGVSAVVMHPDHTPRDAFEQRAVKQLQRGDDRFEEVTGGKLRVATAVPTGGSCFSCHWTPPGKESKAAITWTLPLSRS